MLVSHLIILISLPVFLIGMYNVIHKNKELKTIKNKTHDLHHDINSSLVIIKLTIDSLRDISVKEKDDASIEHPDLTSLVNLLEEGISQIESSFQHWNVSSN